MKSTRVVGYMVSCETLGCGSETDHFPHPDAALASALEAGWTVDQLHVLRCPQHSGYPLPTGRGGTL